MTSTSKREIAPSRSYAGRLRLTSQLLADGPVLPPVTEPAARGMGRHAMRSIGRLARASGSGMLAALALLACGDPIAPASESAPEPAWSRSAGPLPFHGSISGQVVAIAPFAPGSSPECNANFSGDPVAPGPSVSLFDSATGNFSHTGRSTLEAVSCIDPLSPFSSGTGVIRAANGDELRIAFANLGIPRASDPTIVDVTGTQWVTGGSGRFVGASGVQACAFTIRLTSAATGTIDGSCTGTLTYGA